VDDELPVDVKQTIASLSDKVSGLALGYLLLAVAVHAAVRHALHDEVDLVLVVEDPVEVSNVLVNQVRLDLYLPEHMVLQRQLLHPFLGECLEHTQETAAVLAGQEHVAVGAPAQFLDDLEILGHEGARRTALFRLPLEEARGMHGWVVVGGLGAIVALTKLGSRAGDGFRFGEDGGGGGFAFGFVDFGAVLAPPGVLLALPLLHEVEQLVVGLLR
jgi:DNA polymerase III psi subunit